MLLQPFATVMCKHCGTVIRNTIEAMQFHLRRCPKRAGRADSEPQRTP